MDQHRNVQNKPPNDATLGSAGQGKRDIFETKPEDAGTTTEADGSLGNMPREFGRYRIVKTLGEGAMGAVYLARDTELDRDVALKAPKFVDENLELLERFKREARSAATLRHPNICPVYDVGEFGGINFITMAYIGGSPLSDVITSSYEAGKPLSERKAANVARKIALALQEAHANKVVHRDLKPANVMIDQRGEPIVMDFGLARQIEDKFDERLTVDGAMLGTPAYMAPEQIEGDYDKIGPACDIYSLGIVLYEMLAGDRPFQGTGSIVSYVQQVLNNSGKPLSEVRQGVSPVLEAICNRATNREIHARYSSMKDMASALTDFLKGAATVVASKPPVVPPAIKEASLDKLEEQSQQARALWKERKYVDAMAVLQEMVAINDPRAAKYTEWAKGELKRVQSMIESASTASVKSQSTDDFWSGVNNAQMVTPRSPVATTTRPAARRTPRRSSNWYLWLLPIPITILLLLTVLLASGGNDKGKGQANASNSKTPDQSNSNAGQGNVTVPQSNTKPDDPPREISKDEAFENQFRDKFGEFNQFNGPHPKGKHSTNADAAVILMRHDQDGDDKLVRSDLPPHLSNYFTQIDVNRDAYLDRDEVEAFSNDLKERGEHLPPPPNHR